MTQTAGGATPPAVATSGDELLPSMTSLNRYVLSMSLLGVGVLLAFFLGTPADELLPGTGEAWLFAVAVVIGECVPMRLVHHGSDGEITTSSTWAIALLLIAGPAAAMLAIAVGAVVADARQRKSVSRTLFNVGQYTLAIAAAWATLTLLTDLRPPGSSMGADDVPGAVAAAMAFFAVNSLLVARAVALVEGARFWAYLRKDLELQTSTVGILLGLGPIVVIVTEFTPLALPLLALPLIALHRAGRQAVAHQIEALHDGLTGLPNRALLHDRLHQAIVLADRESRTAAVLMLDLDRFKEINDTLGHHEGDELLREVAGRLRGALREIDTVGRLGGDEFAIVLPGTAAADAVEIARGLADVLDQPLRWRTDMALRVRASIGIVVYPEHGNDADELLRHADLAMYEAKSSGGGERLYDAGIDDTSPERLRFVGELQDAVRRRELALHFQPKVSLGTGRIEGLEALVRWPHPTLGLLPPARFLDLAERAGLIGELTSFALDAALRECRSWLDAGLEIQVAVNLSPSALHTDAIVAEVAALLDARGVPGRLLQLELTESSLVADPVTARRTLVRLRELGVSIALDDFGTGYSSLAHLKDLPVDELKIDRAFITGLVDSQAEVAIVRSTIQLAHDLGLRVVAEGVETSAVLARLADLGCDAVQGYLLGRPSPAAVVRSSIDASAMAAAA